MSGEAATIGRSRVEAMRVRPAPSTPSARPPTPGAGEWNWDDLYSRLGPALVALARRRFGLSREDAEEALQMAATAIFLAAPSVRSPEAYLTSVFLRECLGLGRRRAEIRRNEVVLPETFEAADDSCERMQVVCRFRKAFSLLSPFCRAVMRTCLLDGKAKVAAAAESSTSEKTIYRRYRKCLRTLTDALG